MAGQNRGYFLPTTQSWDVTELYEADVNSLKFKELLVRMTQNLGLMAQQVNQKSSGVYDTQEIASGDTFYPNPSYSSAGSTFASPRPIFRKVIPVGPLPNAATSPKSVAHGISFDSSFTLIKLSGSATDPVGFSAIPLPFTSGETPVRSVGISLDSTNIIIKVSPASDFTAYTRAHVVIEFIKN